ncbi:hypothetical protein [Formosa haliotis]|uniref:hypothetical protein n=1 Tax=Formosa haliotis TaxID=1555194 RepID=UPI000825CC30|nr:hypothetical protein [Formosa haliotis]
MKKLALILLGVLIGVVGSQLLETKTDEKEINLEREPPTSESVAPSESDNTFSNPNGLISVQLAEEMSKAYQSRYDAINASHFEKNKFDNRSVWFSLSEIENYIWYAKKQAHSKGLSEHAINGLRVYLAAYVKNKKDPEQPGLTTVFIVPTIDNSKSKSGMPFSVIQQGSSDFTGADPLNLGGAGHPPEATYPQ